MFTVSRVPSATHPVFDGGRGGALADRASKSDPERRARPPTRHPAGLIHASRPRERGDDALAIEQCLRGLNAREAACRIALGALAHELCRGRAYHRLGFARLGDYTRERLGLSPREIESLAQVTTALRFLPAIAAVFARGELSWTQTRVLAAIATPEDQALWLERARGCSGTALAALVRRSGTAPADAAAAPPGASDHRSASPSGASEHRRVVEAAVDEALDLTDGEPAMRFRLRCPSRLRGLFYDTVEIARRVAGEPLPIAEAAEAIAAEALSGAPRGEWAWHLAEPATARSRSSPCR